MAIVTLAELRKHLNIGEAAGDEETLQRKLDAATELVEDRCGYVEEQAVTERVYPASGALLLTGAPILSVTSVTTEADETAVVVADLDVDIEARMITKATGRFSGVHLVTYQAGREEIPEAIKEATLLVAEQLYQSARGPVPQAKYAENSGTPPRGFAWPYRAKQLTEPYTLDWVVV